MIAFLKTVPLLAALAVPAAAADSKTETKNVTHIRAESSADGRSEIAREKTMDCVLSLPDAGKLSPVVTSEAVFADGLNGKSDDKEWIKAYTARIDVNYLTREKEVLIVTTRSVQGQAPVIQEVSKTLRHAESFVSDAANGDAFAGRSNRQYYFTTAEGASKDARDRAAAWIDQQKSVVCPEK